MIDILKEEEEFYENIWGKLFLFSIPFLIASLYIILLHLILIDLNNTFWIVGGAMLTYLIPPLGKESVIPGTIGILSGLNVGLSPFTIIFLVSASIAFVDIVTSYFLLWNFYIAKKIPLVGKWIDRFQKYGAKKMKEKTWIKKLASIGVASFVIFPFQGSGGVGASILGRVIGMNKYHAWLSITVGAFVGCFFIGLIAYFTGGAIISAFQSGIFRGVAALLLVIVVFILVYRFTKSRLIVKTE
ncbi:MAG: small multi-drug export protein [Thermoplasmata archaeon]